MTALPEDDRPAVVIEAILLKDRCVVTSDGAALPIISQFDTDGDPVETFEEAEFIVFGAPGRGFFNIRLRDFRTQYTFH